MINPKNKFWIFALVVWVRIISSIYLDLEQSTIPFKIDFVDMEKASDVLKQSISREGILLQLVV